MNIKQLKQRISVISTLAIAVSTNKPFLIATVDSNSKPFICSNLKATDSIKFAGIAAMHLAEVNNISFKDATNNIQQQMLTIYRESLGLESKETMHE
jgi:hypothetical protein